ncbi:hypothetical protein MKK69_30720 [Methylobacterium sp. J-026]|uniref:hypothetical protein n=1 Tax=Methylobacterium sp. J-026 TaxID=2836624 RepID=UPI001FBA045D|nr:hypothetical protein [Methylobacterium sp. J-026]MCJ2138378.1 hypothetical protein [Methylobacterium sp. J-026]
MDYVPSMAAVAAAAQKSPHADAVSIAASNVVSPVAPATLDPRPAYALSPGTADAMLTLTRTTTLAVEVVEFDTRFGHGSRTTEAATAAASAPVVSPEPGKASSAANRNWTEDVRLDHIPTRRIGTDLVVEYDTPRVMAAWSAAFPDIASRKFRGLRLADTNVYPDLRKVVNDSGIAVLEKDIYLLCNGDNYKSFSQNHPGTRINWIAVDNEDIVLAWPKHSDPGSAAALAHPVAVHDDANRGA